jgi:hypothetical protein
MLMGDQIFNDRLVDEGLWFYVETVVDTFEIPTVAFIFHLNYPINKNPRQ